MVINPNTNEAVGNICPVTILSRYIAMQQSLSGTLQSDPLFPKTQLIHHPVGGRSIVYMTTLVKPVRCDSFCQTSKKLYKLPYNNN